MEYAPYNPWQIEQHHQNPDHWLLIHRTPGGSHALNFRTEDEARAKYAEWEALGRCRECGDVLHNGYCKPYKERIVAEQTCFGCMFWLDLLNQPDRKSCIVVNGYHYTISPDEPKGYRGFLGHGGAEFRIRFKDGREVVSHNLWAQGQVPNWFRSRFPDTAEFVQRGHRSVGSGFAGYSGPGTADSDYAR